MDKNDIIIDSIRSNNKNIYNDKINRIRISFKHLLLSMVLLITANIIRYVDSGKFKFKIDNVNFPVLSLIAKTIIVIALIFQLVSSIRLIKNRKEFIASTALIVYYLGLSYIVNMFSIMVLFALSYSPNLPNIAMFHRMYSLIMFFANIIFIIIKLLKYIFINRGLKNITNIDKTKKMLNANNIIIIVLLSLSVLLYIFNSIYPFGSYKLLSLLINLYVFISFIFILGRMRREYRVY